MEMELQAGAVGAQFAFGSGDHRLRKRARVAHGENPETAGVVEHGRQQDGVAKGRTV
jgi:hypothetical protein